MRCPAPSSMLHQFIIATTAMIFLQLSSLSSATAQHITVRTGEHSGFTRVVLHLKARIPWRLHRNEYGYTLSTPHFSPIYQLQGIYKRIKRDRLSEITVSPQNGALELRLDCHCHISPFELLPNLLVLDIKDGPPRDGAPWEFAENGRAMAPIRPRLPIRPMLRPAAFTPSPELWRQDISQAAQRPHNDQLALPTLTRHDQSLRAAFLWQIAQAASQNLIELTVPLTKMNETVEHMRAISDLSSSLGIRSSTDRDALPHLNTAGDECLPDELLNLTAWGREGEVAQTMGSGASSLLSEFDTPDEGAITQLIRSQLHIGFGAEAAQLAQRFLPNAPNTAIWQSLGHLIDGTPPAQHPFQGMHICSGNVALWSLLAEPSRAHDAHLNKSAVIQGFSQLPLGLRQHLGPRLVDIFLTIEDQGSATQISEAATRTPFPPSPAVALMSAKVTQSTSPHIVQDEAFLRLTPAPAGTGIDATTALLQARLHAGTPIENELLHTAAAFLHDIRDNSSAAPLAEALSLALARQGRLKEALIVPQRPPSNTIRLWDIFASHAKNASLIEEAIMLEPSVINQLSDATRQLVAQRLLDLGLSNHSFRWVAQLETTTARIVRARAFLHQRDGRNALQAIAGLEGEEADTLRASALAFMQDPSALPLFERLGQTYAQSAAARRNPDHDWNVTRSLNEDWALLAPPAFPEPLATEAPNSVSTLHASRDQLATSRATREAVNNILSQIQNTSP